ncbi:hypothetical protein PYCC9005_004551 [Savitreella phatthalungensis]
MASAEESQLAETRKRKIDAVLGLLDGHTESSSPKSVVAIAGSPLSLGLPTTPRPEGRQTTRYNPWDADACSKRLASFRPWAHHDQRSPINAYLLARHGWRLVPDDIRRVSAARLSVTAPGTPQQRPQTPTLTSPATPNNPPGTPTAFSAESPGSRVKARYCTIECVGCGARVVCDTNSQVAGVSRKLAAKYGERLMGDDPAHGHRKDCLWRTKPCVGNILHVRGPSHPGNRHWSSVRHCPHSRLSSILMKTKHLHRPRSWQWSVGLSLASPASVCCLVGHVIVELLSSDLEASPGSRRRTRLSMCSKNTTTIVRGLARNLKEASRRLGGLYMISIWPTRQRAARTLPSHSSGKLSTLPSHLDSAIPRNRGPEE